MAIDLDAVGLKCIRDGRRDASASGRLVDVEETAVQAEAHPRPIAATGDIWIASFWAGLTLAVPGATSFVALPQRAVIGTIERATSGN